MVNAYRIKTIRQLEQLAFSQNIMSEWDMMQHAGQQAFALLRHNYPAAKRLAVLCGGGNNGGDGYVLAACAQQAGLEVTVFQVGDPSKLAATAQQALQLCVQAQVPLQAWQAASAVNADVIVDALLGIGAQGAPRDVIAQAIDAMNASGDPVFALDVPSGLNADTGVAAGVAVRAQHTVTFIANKAGLLTGQAAEFCGHITVADLSLPASLLAKLPVAVHGIATENLLHTYLPARAPCAFKNDFGHVLIVGGGPGMLGAVLMAGKAAARSGAGLVSIATHPEHAALVSAQQAELMSHAIGAVDELKPLLARATVVVLGPGLGQSAWAQGVFDALLSQSQLPLVVDADALNLLAMHPQQRANWILTPHPGEAGRLLAQSTQQVQHDRYTACAQLQQRYGGVVVLKGAGSLVSDGDHTAVCVAGNPGMATAGMGDVLSGISAGLLAQGVPLFSAAQLAVGLHAKAADAAAAAQGQRGLLATDILPHVQRLVNA